MGYGEAKRRAPAQRLLNGEKDYGWLINFSLTAVAAGALVLFGHWFSAKGGKRLGGERKRHLPTDGERQDVVTRDHGKPMSLVELRFQRLRAVEERLSPKACEPSAVRLTPLGVVLELKQKVDMLEGETNSLCQNTLASHMSPVFQKERLQLLELLVQIQLELDAVKVAIAGFCEIGLCYRFVRSVYSWLLQADESIRAHRKVESNRIQSLIARLEKLNGDADA